MERVIEAIKRHKIIVIMRRVPGNKVMPVAQALHDGGIRLFEVTFDQSDSNHLNKTGEAIRLLSENFDDIYVGAGTVLTQNQLAKAKSCGAQFIISPNFDREIVKRTLENNLVSIPGAFTPSEVVAAHGAGAHFVKVFPGGDFGSAYLKAITAPLSHIPLLVVGGVNAENMQDFIKGGAAGFGIGSGIVNKKSVESGDYPALTELARTYVEKI